MTEEPVKPAEPSPKPANPSPNFFATLASSLSNNDPTELLRATGMPEKDIEKLKASMDKDNERWAVMGGRMDRMAEAIQFMADNIDKLSRATVVHGMATERHVELIQRAMKKLPGFVEAYEQGVADMEERDRLAREKWDKEHPRSAVSQPVTTLPTPNKSP